MTSTNTDTNAAGRQALAVRAPEVGDGAEIWSLVRNSGALDVNSPYAYLLACRHHAGTSLVAERAGRLVGFVLAYRPPRQPDTVFVWQIAVAREARRQGLGGRLLRTLVERQVPTGVSHLETTITPSNEPSWRLFRGLARTLGVSYTQAPGFPAELFPDEGDGEPAHEREELVRIGPFGSDTGL